MPGNVHWSEITAIRQTRPDTIPKVSGLSRSERRAKRHVRTYTGVVPFLLISRPNRFALMHLGATVGIRTIVSNKDNKEKPTQ